MSLNLRTIIKSFSLFLLSFLLVAGVLYAATTIGTNIDTAGTLLVNNATSTITNLVLVNATSTNATTTALYVSGLPVFTGGLLVNNATSTITNLVLVNATSTNATTTTLYASGVSNLATASSTGLVKVHQLKVANGGSTVAGMVFGYCTLGAATVSAASTTYSVCSGATGILSGDRIFVQATSSLPVATVVSAASSTAADTISVRFHAGAGATDISAGTVSLNFWAVR